MNFVPDSSGWYALMYQGGSREMVWYRVIGWTPDVGADDELHPVAAYNVYACVVRPEALEYMPGETRAVILDVDLRAAA